jgi:hypothetical protein
VWWGVFQDVSSWFSRLVTNQFIHFSQVESLLEEAFRTADRVYGEDEALEWAGGFTFPESILRGHQDRFNLLGGELLRLIEYQKRSITQSRMSVQSVMNTISQDNPEIHKLLQLVNGMPLCADPSLIPNGRDNPPKLAPSYKKLFPVVNRMLYEDFVSAGLALVLPRDWVLSCGVQFHLSKLSWTPKHGKKKGRPILDCSAGIESVNSDYTKWAGDNLWGVIEHPSIGDLVRMISDFFIEARLMSPHARWEDLIMWKIDLKGAYTLLSFEDSAVPFMAAELDSNSIILFLCGVFGWTGTPAAFQVVSRALEFQINRSIDGRVSPE